MQPDIVKCERGVGVARLEQRLASHEVGLAVGTDKLTTSDDSRGVEVVTTVLLNDSETSVGAIGASRLNTEANPANRGRARAGTSAAPRRGSPAGRIWKHQQVHAQRIGVRREVLNTHQRLLDVAQDLWRLAGANPDSRAHRDVSLDPPTGCGDGPLPGRWVDGRPVGLCQETAAHVGSVINHGSACTLPAVVTESGEIIQINGVDLYARGFGDPGLPVLIVAHGGPTWDHSYLLPAVARLADVRHVSARPTG